VKRDDIETDFIELFVIAIQCQENIANWNNSTLIGANLLVKAIDSKLFMLMYYK
jgi:hypothetical protein